MCGQARRRRTRKLVKLLHDIGEGVTCRSSSISFISMADIDYYDGEQFPVLERVEGAADYLDDIVNPLSSSEQQPAQPKTTAANR
jgi:hypothetical protein